MDKRNTLEDEVIAINFAGIIPYYAERKAIDLTGLNDIHIGHLGRGLHKNYDSEYVLGKKPDYIIISTRKLIFNGSDYNLYYAWEGEMDLYYQPDFKKYYYPRLDIRFDYPNLWLFQRNFSIS